MKRVKHEKDCYDHHRRGDFRSRSNNLSKKKIELEMNERYEEYEREVKYER